MYTCTHDVHMHTGAMIKCNYRGTLESGREFDKSRPGRPLGFTVGVSGLIGLSVKPDATERSSAAQRRAT